MVVLRYPDSQRLSEDLSEEEIRLKIARHSPCSYCNCAGLHPTADDEIIPDDGGAAEDVSMLESCDCGHDVVDHGNSGDIPHSERVRRAKVAIRLDELLEDKGKFVDFAYMDSDILSLRRQMKVIPEDGFLPSDSDSLQPRSTLSPLSQPEREDEAISPRSATSPAVTTSSLSDEEEEDQPLATLLPSHEEEDKPLASRMPANSTGSRIGKKTKSKHKGPANSSATEPFTPQIKEERPSPSQLAKLVTGVTVDTASPMSARPEKPCVAELRNGIIRVTPVHSDGNPKSLIILTGLKTLFQKQLPKMPRDYISRLVYDHNSRALAIVKNGWKVVGGILFRPFAHRGFAEIVFFATASIDQIKGYGGMLMNHFKMHIKNTYPGMLHFLTYADNYAVGYFKKQGFSKDVTLDRSAWAGYIKDYEGATILQCAMLPSVDYIHVRELLNGQREVILSKIREKSESHVVHPGLTTFRDINGDGGSELDPKEVPGLRETGWNFSMSQESITAPVNPKQTIMHQLLTNLQNHPQAWAFLQPVNGEEVSDYYDVVKKPMDFNTMEHKVSTGLYNSIGSFVEDARLVFHNCLLYNPEGSVYAKNATKMDKFLDDQLAILAPDEIVTLSQS